MDRNTTLPVFYAFSKMSLSARRAWIEIADTSEVSERVPLVALRKESVDRNQTSPPIWMLTTQSLSARRAWIEILFRPIIKNRPSGRSPQGERG